MQFTLESLISWSDRNIKNPLFSNHLQHCMKDMNLKHWTASACEIMEGVYNLYILAENSLFHIYYVEASDEEEANWSVQMIELEDFIELLEVYREGMKKPIPQIDASTSNVLH